PIRRRTKPPRTHQSDGGGHRNVQAESGTRGRDRVVTAGNQRVQHRSGHAAEHGSWQQDSLPLSV
ncbi:transposase, partial [Streptomyces sp. NPDC051219]